MPRAARTNSRVDFTILGACLLLAGAAYILPGEPRRAVASGLRQSVLAPLVGLQAAIERTRTAFLSHDKLTRLADSLALRTTGAAALEGENARLRSLLGLASDLRWGFVPAEALHGRGLGQEYTVTLAAGSEVGVRRFSPVVAPEGLVGMVETADAQSSQAILWAHPDFRVSAMAVDGSAFGIVKAHLDADSGAGRWLLEMSGVPFRSELKPGTTIVSSGLGGTYPRGIPIGVVMRELVTAEGWARTYLLRPAVSPADVSSVMILTAQRVQAGVQNVWVSAPAADSAARAIVSAGDSLARQAALAEVAARRAATDSVAADSLGRAPAPPAPPVPAAGVPPRDTTVRRDSAAVRPAPRRDSAARPAPRRDTTARPAPPARPDTTTARP